MFADDELMDFFVLKGRNAMDLAHQMNSRASIELDFSTAGLSANPSTLKYYISIRFIHQRTSEKIGLQLDTCFPNFISGCKLRNNH
jgi:hypothetical protein